MSKRTDKYEMEEFCKNVWLNCEYEAQAKKNANPLEKMAKEARAKAEAEERAKVPTKNNVSSELKDLNRYIYTQLHGNR